MMPTLKLVKDDVRDFMATKEGSNRKSDVDTKKSKLFRGTIHLCELSMIMMDVSQQLKLHHDVMTNRDSSSAVQHSSLAILHKSIIPIISVVADSLERSATNFAPIPGTSYVRKILEQDNKIEDPIKLIDDVVKKRKEDMVSSPPKFQCRIH